MIRIIFTLLFSLFTLVSINSQEQIQVPDNSLNWEDMMLRPEFNFYDIQKAFNKRWKNQGYIKDDGYKLFKRWEYMMESIIDVEGNFDKNLLESEILRYQESQTVDNRVSSGNWAQLGPFGFISEYGLGRVNVVAYDPNDNNVLWLGAASGGLWKSIDGGQSWVSLSNDFRMMGISDIVVDPEDSDVVYIATGDRDAGDTYTYGIFKSLDGGNTWTKTNFPNADRITRVLLNPENSQQLYASTNGGIYKTNDGGNNWDYILSGSYIREMEFKPGDFNTVYATKYSYSGGSFSFFRTGDGIHFSKVPVSGISEDVSRVSIGVTPDNPEIVYLCAGINKSGWDENDFDGIFKSLDSGLTFSKVVSDIPPELGSQSWYDWTFAVSPDNSDELFAGGVRFYRSTDGGVNWDLSSNWDNPNNNDHFHVDHHYAGFQPETNVLFVGNDGGVYKSENKGLYWESLNEDLSITQYYEISSAANDPALIIGGSQDNGTHLLKEGDWNRVMGGDGMECIIDYSNSDIIYASYQQGYLRKSKNKGRNFRDMLTSDMTGEAGAWVTPFVIDPKQPNILYAGYESIWKTEDYGDNWDKISTKLYDEATVRGIKVAPSNTDYIYVFYYDALFRSTDKGSTWEEINKPSGSSINDLVISHIDPNKLWLAMYKSVYTSLDGGNSWTEITGTLPNVPMTALEIQNNDNESLYVGTYIGVFYTNNTLSDWIPFNEGLPPVRIGELEIMEQFGKIRAGSYGRGMWESELYDIGPNLPLCSNLISPENGSKIVDDNVELEWRKIWNADGYKVRIGTQLGGNDILDDLDVGDNTKYQWNDITAEGKVFIKILPYNDTGYAEGCQEDSISIGCFFEDRSALVDIFNSAGGNQWKNKWDTTDCDIRNWYGVTTDIEGHVISLDLDGFVDNDHTNNSSGNKLSGILDNEINKLVYLQKLYLSNNSLTGSIPESISNLTGLKELDLSFNDFSGSFPDDLTNLKSLEYLNISNNNFSGEITSNFNNWSDLKELHLNNNNFSGNLPVALGTLKNCWMINASRNQFSGKIPFQLWFLQNLYVLDLSFNKLSGKLSKRIASLETLEYVHLNDNEMTGEIPEDLGNKNWEIFYMSNNNLEGCFPDNLKNLCSNSSNIKFDGNTLLPNNGNFSFFCNFDKGNCDKIPQCSNGLVFSTTGDTLPYNLPVMWSKVESAEGYYISLGTSSNGIDIANEVDVVDTIFNAGDMPKNTRIYANILPYNTYGESYDCTEFSFVTSNPTGIVEKDTINFGSFVKIYPNPAKDFIVVKKLSNDLKEFDLQIVDVNGKLVEKKNIERNINEKIIDTSKLPSGVYFIKMNLSDIVFFKKLAVQ